MLLYNTTIKKTFSFDGMHVVRNCSSSRCKYSMHAHTYKVDVEFGAEGGLDNGEMIVDFGLMKGTVKDIVKSFDGAVTLWDKDDEAYISDVKSAFDRWVSIPRSPSAESYAEIIYTMLKAVNKATTFNNGEKNPLVIAVTVAETRTGCATVRGILQNPVNLKKIKFSTAVKQAWADPKLWKKTKRAAVNDTYKPFTNAKVEQQVQNKKGKR